MIKRILIFTIVIPFLISCGASKSLNNQKAQNSKTVANYLKETSELTKVQANKFYYVSTQSDSNFLKKIQPSILTFIKGDETATIDSLQLPQNKNVTGLNSSCGVNDVTKKIIEYNLKKSPKIDYHSMVLKSLKDYKIYNFPKDKIISLLLYSKKMGPFANQYIDAVKRLKKEYGIDFIIVMMDGQELKEIKDIYYDSFDNDVRVEVN